jgi:hypothetical protein
VNSLQQQLFGEIAITVTDTTSLRALGDQISGSNLYDKFAGAAIDRIGKVIIRTLDSIAEYPGLLVDEMVFGAMVEKLSFDIPDADANTAWEISDPAFVPDQFDVTVPDVKNLIFKGLATWRCRATVPDEPMMNSAFNNASEMMAFFTGITESMRVSMVEKLNAVSKAVIASMIAEKADATSASYINLLTLYNSLFTPTLTATEALTSPEFLRWAGAQIELALSYLDTPSTLYCEAFPDGTKVPRRTFRDNCHVFLHTQFVNASKTYMQADVFNRSLVELPLYKEVKMWQGSGQSVIPDPSDTMQINVITKSGDTVQCDYVLGCLADRQSIAISRFQTKTASDRNNINGYTNFATTANISHMVDLTENVICFALADPTITPPSP